MAPPKGINMMLWSVKELVSSQFHYQSLSERRLKQPRTDTKATVQGAKSNARSGKSNQMRRLKQRHAEIEATAHEGRSNRAQRLNQPRAEAEAHHAEAEATIVSNIIVSNNIVSIFDSYQ